MEHLARGMDYSYTGSETAAAVLRALPSHKNIVQHLPDGGTLISEVTIIIVLLINARIHVQRIFCNLYIERCYLFTRCTQ